MIAILKEYWLPILLFVSVIWLNNTAYDRGYNTADVEWKIKTQEAKDEAIEKGNQKSKELEAIISELETANKKLNRSLKNEIRKNNAAYACSIPNDGVQFFNQSTGSSNTTKQPSNTLQ